MATNDRREVGDVVRRGKKRASGAEEEENPKKER